MKNRIILIKSSKMKRLQIIGKAFIKMHKKIKNKFLKKSYFQCWWFRTIFLFSVTKIQKVFRGFRFRKSQLGQLIKKEFKKFKKNYKMCGKFRRNCRLKNIFSGLRKNVLLCQNEREVEEEKFKIKKYFHRYYLFAQIRMKISYIDYKRNLFKKEKKMKKGMFLLQYVAAKNILQKNIHLESLLYHRNFLLYHGFSRLLTKNQKELKKLKLNQNFHNNRLKIEQKNRIISSRMDFHYDNNINNNVRNKYNKNDNMINNNNNDINDNYSYNNIIVNYDNYSKNNNCNNKNILNRNYNLKEKKVQFTENISKQLANSITFRQLVDPEPDSILKTNTKIKNIFGKEKDLRQDFLNFYSPITKRNFRRKGFKNLKIYQEIRYFDRYFLLCCETHWAFPYFQQFFKLLKTKKKKKLFSESVIEKMKFNAILRLFSNWRYIAILKKRNNKIRISKVFHHSHLSSYFLLFFVYMCISILFNTF